MKATTTKPKDLLLVTRYDKLSLQYNWDCCLLPTYLHWR